MLTHHIYLSMETEYNITQDYQLLGICKIMIFIFCSFFNQYMTGKICRLIILKKRQADLQCHHLVYFSMSVGILPNFPSILLLEISSLTFLENCWIPSVAA